MSSSARRRFIRAMAVLVLCVLRMPAERYEENGISIEFSAKSANAGAATLRENSDISFRFRVSEAVSGNPLGSRRVAAWIDPAGGLTGSASCKDKVKGFLEGSFFYRPAADLNSYYVLTLNREPTISVVDPLVGYGGTHELTTVALPGAGIDWALDARQARILVSMPEAKKVAVVDTSNWKVSRTIDVPGQPGRILFQPDRQYVWVAWEADGESGVAVYNGVTLELAARIVTGRGSHEIAFSNDSRFAFVTDSDDADVATVDVRKLAVTRRDRTGAEPVSVAFSPLSGMAYVANRKAGTITAISTDANAKTVTIAADPGVGPVRFAPGGRLGFALNPSKDLVYVIDAAVNKVVQTGDVEKDPDQIVFSSELAYIRHRNSSTILMIPLGAAGQSGQPVHVADFPGGQHVLGASGPANLADGIAQAPGENAIWLANPGDRMIYFYQEGMAAPKGSFVVSQEPRAVMVLDRSLQQTSPGVYETVARLPGAGKYTVATLLDSPQTIHCFELSVEADPAKRPVSKMSASVEMLGESAPLLAGAKSRIRFRFMDAATGLPRMDLKDVRVLTFLPPGLQDRQSAKALGDGVYEIDFQPSDAGLYQVSVECPTVGLSYGTLPAWRVSVMKR